MQDASDATATALGSLRFVQVVRVVPFWDKRMAQAFAKAGRLVGGEAHGVNSWDNPLIAQGLGG